MSYFPRDKIYLKPRNLIVNGSRGSKARPVPRPDTRAAGGRPTGPLARHGSRLSAARPFNSGSTARGRPPGLQWRRAQWSGYPEGFFHDTPRAQERRARDEFASVRERESVAGRSLFRSFRGLRNPGSGEVSGDGGRGVGFGRGTTGALCPLPQIRGLRVGVVSNRWVPLQTGTNTGLES